MLLFSINPPTDLQDDYYKNHNKHVQRTVKSWAVVLLVIYIILIGMAVFRLTGPDSSSERATPIFNLIFYAIGLVTWVLLLIGSWNLIWWLFLPKIVDLFCFTIYMGATTVLSIIETIGIVAMNDNQYNAYAKDHAATAGSTKLWTVCMSAVAALILFLITSIILHMFGVVVRACQHAYFAEKSGDKDFV
ncbi:hypothetical protein M3Y97_01093300 [Aphelenchoides bicaudatus]|nr:hypothetical protein M3Y97_01093300 [Aphelenchoides bicaudatus]